ncbi:MAG: hypothetical protein NC307_12465 [Roseburia sp.]|nr:hypothetical protein [Roseburia sp.]
MKRYFKATLTEKNIERSKKVQCHYMGNNAKVVEPIFKNPMAVYVVELTIPAYMLLLGTTDYLKIERQFYKSLKDAMEKNSESAESFFEKLIPGKRE